jgi:hypothetical protein
VVRAECRENTGSMLLVETILREGDSLKLNSGVGFETLLDMSVKGSRRKALIGSVRSMRQISLKGSGKRWLNSLFSFNPLLFT